MLGQMMEPVSVRKPKTKNIIRNMKKSWVLDGCRNREPRIVRSLFLAEGALEELNNRLQRRYRKIQTSEVRYEISHKDSDLFVVAYGSVSRIARPVIGELRAEGYRVGLIRPISLWPYPYEAIRSLASQGKRFLVVEMSAGQMLEDVRLAVSDDSRVSFLGRTGGGIPQEEEIANKIKEAVNG
jgi:2-oxoglutarate ferredoxin oxidoreductase subunit alpha